MAGLSLTSRIWGGGAGSNSGNSWGQLSTALKRPAGSTPVRTYSRPANTAGVGNAGAVRTLGQSAAPAPTPQAAASPVVTPPTATVTAPATETATAGGPVITEGNLSPLAPLVSNPESLSPEVQATMLQQVRNSRDQALQDQIRAIRETAGGAGLGDAGLTADQVFRAGLSRDADLANAEAALRANAATTNFQNRLDVTNEIANLTNQLFNTGVNSQQQQMSVLNNLGNLVGQGTGYNQNLLQTIWSQLMQRYASPNVAAATQYSYAPNPYVNTGGGGGGNSGANWLSAGGALGSGIAALAGLF